MPTSLPPLGLLLPLLASLPLASCRGGGTGGAAPDAGASAGAEAAAGAGVAGAEVAGEMAEDGGSAPMDGAAAAGAKPTEEELRARLTDEQYRVTQQCGTEPPFRNAYWDHKEPGIYVDVVSGEPLFASLHKFDSGTGWPSFYQPLVPGNLKREKDYEIGYERIEVRSAKGDSHLGHVFEDAPRTPTGLRYCINSAALRFVPVDRLEEEGYGEFVALFEGAAADGKDEPQR